MNQKYLILGMLTLAILSCNSSNKETRTNQTSPDVKMAGTMRDVMWGGKLGSSIDLDTISNKVGLYGLGPITFLSGELLIKDGVGYVSKVTSDSTMIVEKTFDVSAPFFVYANVTDWEVIELPSTIKDLKELETFIDTQTKKSKRPFAFKLMGSVSKALIHVQNLPEGSKVSSPEEAHLGQTNYLLKDKNVEIVGFFSTEHKGIFTHHDSFLHMHLISSDEKEMGHLDELEIESMKLYLPKN
jgi:acetolactate decarboxylase